MVASQGQPRPLRAVVPITMLVVLALSGCLGGSEGPTGGNASEAAVATGPAAPESLAWGLSTCDYVVWFIDVPAENLRPYLPEGFETAPMGLVALASPDFTYFGFEAFVCDAGAGLEGTVPGMTYGSIFAAAVPPAEHEVPGIDDQYYVKWDMLVPDADRRAVLAGAGAPVHDGSAAVTLPDGPVGTVTASFTLDGFGSFSITGVTDGPMEPRGETPFVEYMPADDGLVRWQAETADAVGAGGRLGTWQAQPGTWAADVLGGTEGVAGFNAGTWTFTNASFTFPG